MKEFEDLIATTEHLLGPEGCVWDRQQTMASTRPCIVEEAAELVDAIDSEDNHHILEELADLLFVVLFLCKLAEKENRCTLKDVLKFENEKLIRRHPHVFGDAKIDSVEELLHQWNKIKQKEKGKAERKSSLSGIPKGLPSLARAQKVYSKIKKTQFPVEEKKMAFSFQDEEALGTLLWDVVRQAETQELDAEHALRKKMGCIERSFTSFEEKNVA